LPLLEWLHSAVFPAEARWADPDFAAAMSARVGQRLAAHGTIGLAAYATVHHEGAQRAIDTLGALGLWGFAGQVLMDQHAPPELCRPARQLLDESSALRAAHRIAPSINPRFAVACSMPLMVGAAALARSSGRLVQTHLAETLDEAALVARLHAGLPYLKVYQQAGLLDHPLPGRTLFAHAIHVDAEDLDLLRAAGATIAHCPTANLVLGAGSMNFAAAQRAGVAVGLGSDVAGGPDVSMVRVARAFIETAKTRAMTAGASIPGANRQVPDAAHAWWRVTAGNARVLGRADHGALRPGAPADLVVIEPCGDSARRLGVAHLAWTRAPDPLSALLYAWDDRWINAVYAGGRMIYSSTAADRNALHSGSGTTGTI
jgi:guanine deaminase